MLHAYEQKYLVFAVVKLCGIQLLLHATTATVCPLQSTSLAITLRVTRTLREVADRVNASAAVYGAEAKKITMTVKFSLKKPNS